MGLWEFLQQWPRGRFVAGVAASVLLHVAVVAILMWAGQFPLTPAWRAKPGDSLIVELAKPNASPAPGSPDAPATPPTPSGPPNATAPSSAPAAPPAAPKRPAATREVPAPRPTASTRQVASAPRPPEPAKPAPRPAEQPPQPPAESAAESGAEKAPSTESTPSSATPKVERVPPGPPSNPQVAGLPPGGAHAPQSLPDIRSALRRGAGGHGEGWEGIEGEPIPLDTSDPDFSPFLQQVKRQIQAKWVFPCLKNPVTHECEQHSARLYVLFGIHKSGRLQVVELQASSGYRVYDDYALNAIRLAAPYPPVPPAMLAKLKSTNAGVPIVAQFNYIVSTSYGTLLQ